MNIENFKNKKILVTGANGFVGSNLIIELNKQGFSNLLTPSSTELNLINQNDVEKYFEEGNIFEKVTFSDKGDPYLQYPNNFYTLEDLELDKLINPERRVNYGMFFAK